MAVCCGATRHFWHSSNLQGHGIDSRRIHREKQDRSPKEAENKVLNTTLDDDTPLVRRHGPTTIDIRNMPNEYFRLFSFSQLICTSWKPLFLCEIGVIWKTK